MVKDDAGWAEWCRLISDDFNGPQTGRAEAALLT
jgi:hypothetical protein